MSGKKAINKRLFKGWWAMYVKKTKTLYISINFRLFTFKFKKA